MTVGERGDWGVLDWKTTVINNLEQLGWLTRWRMTLEWSWGIWQNRAELEWAVTPTFVSFQVTLLFLLSNVSVMVLRCGQQGAWQKCWVIWVWGLISFGVIGHGGKWWERKGGWGPTKEGCECHTRFTIAPTFWRHSVSQGPSTLTLGKHFQGMAAQKDLNYPKRDLPVS